MKGLRIGWLGSVWPDLPLAPGVRELCESALQTFATSAATVEPHQLDVPREQNWTAWLRLRQLLVGGKLGAAYRRPALRDKLKPEARWEIEQSHQLDAAALYQASVLSHERLPRLPARFRALRLRGRADGAGLSLRRGLHWPATVAGVASDTYHRWMEIVTPFTLAGLPDAQRARGLRRSGLPMGLQIAGPSTRTWRCCGWAHAYDQACGWGLVRPPVAGSLPG